MQPFWKKKKTSYQESCHILVTESWKVFKCIFSLWEIIFLTSKHAHKFGPPTLQSWHCPWKHKRPQVWLKFQTKNNTDLTIIAFDWEKKRQFKLSYTFNIFNDLFNIWRSRGVMVKGRMQIKKLHTWDLWISSSLVTSPTQSKWGQSQVDTGAIVYLQIWNKKKFQEKKYIFDKYRVSLLHLYQFIYQVFICETSHFSHHQTNWSSAMCKINLHPFIAR